VAAIEQIFRGVVFNPPNTDWECALTMAQGAMNRARGMILVHWFYHPFYLLLVRLSSNENKVDGFAYIY
jgi:hypothetical protein